MKLWRSVSVVILASVILAGFEVKKRAVDDGPLSDSVVVNIAKGASVQQSAEILHEQGVIDSPLLLRLVLKYQGNEGKLKAGEYLFEPHISMMNVIAKLVRGDVVYHKITIPEGYTVGQVLYLLNNDEALSGEFEVIPEEGAFLPETYIFQRNESRDVIVQKAAASMQKKLQEVWDNRAENLPYKDMGELLVMASIIEKETGVDEERAKVSSVFVNRLRQGMRLQTDPTVIYALTEGKSELGRALTRKDLEIDSPYNTYKYAGLPPTPICNPGAASLYAAAHPDSTDYLYFVASGNGGHNFAKSLKEHNQNVTNWKNNRQKALDEK